MQMTLICRGIARLSVTGSLAALISSMFATGAFAQQEQQLEEITVTGSRIARDANLSGALPVQSVGEQEIQMSGEFSISDIVNDVPALLSSVTSESSIDAAVEFSDGANVLDLRGLGANRTLVLVNGRRHVGGVQGSAAVDVGSIPTKLVERVEVLTGGASAIYGADAVTGVVNFILKDNFEGFNVDANYGISSESDAAQKAITATWGTNFADDRGNIVISVDYRTDEGLRMGDRPGANYGTGGDWVNPALRFQRGDIDASNTPNFAQYFNYDNTGLINYGLPIPDAATFMADYLAEFGVNPTLTSGEQALIDRAANAPQRAVHPEITFPFTSGYGYVAPGEAFGFGGFDPDVAVDLNNNGVPDCQDSWSGYNSVFGAASFGAIGGCWTVQEDGSYRVVEDGLVSGNFQGFGGSSYDVYRQDYYDFLLPEDKVSVNLLGHYDLTDSMSLFGELKYVSQETDATADPNSFWDLILGAPDNPFLPQFLSDIAQTTGGVSITPDPVHFRARRKTERETSRAVIGIEGELDNSWGYEVSATYGRFEQNINRSGQIINDRWFAALDATTDGSGQPVCRSSIDPLAPPSNTPFEIPSYEAGYYTFTPGDGSCVPLDIWNGLGGVSQAAKDFMTTNTWDKLIIDQFVFSAFLTGDTSDFLELPAGPISFAGGVEYRDESSDASFDPWQRGELPPGSAFAPGTQISDYSANSSLVFRPQLSTKDEKGSYDVSDIFIEASIPLLSDMPGARELTLDVAARQSDYSSIGQTTTWKANMVYAPVDSLAFRGTYSEAVRAPNITELFGPEVGLNFRPNDPCDAAQINAIGVDNPTLAAQTQANCVAVFSTFGLDPFTGGTYTFVDPLSASFGGVTGGNRLLQEETAETFTVGLVFQPSFVEGLSMTVDYWDISIDNAIEAVSSQNIVDGCYQGPSLNDTFCSLSARNMNPASAQYGGFNFLRQTTINFARVETSGIDFMAKYGFEVGQHGFDITVQGTKVDKINDFENPLDPTFKNPELLEINRPELAGNVFLSWTVGNLRLGWQSQFLDEMLFRDIEVETAVSLYGSNIFQEAFWQHDFNASYLINDDIMVYGGIKNVTDEQPFITETAFPASPRGTFFFIGLDYTVQ